MITKTAPFASNTLDNNIDALASSLEVTTEELIKKILYFDIETTGFSAKNTHCYLIGCVFYKDGNWNYIQWFADSVSDEILVIWNFFNFAADYRYIAHFNGDGFDIPYLLDKCKMLRMPYNFDNYISIDLLKAAKSVKELLKLENYKQKTIESFLGIYRDDKYSGGELINVYNELPKLALLEDKTAYNDSCNLLLLHNHDDICALVKLTSIFNYLHIEPINIDNNLYYNINDTTDYGGDPVKEIIFSYKLPFSVSSAVSLGKEPYYFKLTGNTAYLRVRMLEGELKHFFPNHKDYYYLPDEDKAIHKSVALYVDKNFRTQAKAVNCYIKKSGVFLPLITESEPPHFKVNYSDKQIYTELSALFLEDNCKLTAYVKSVIKHLLPSYRKTSYHTHNPVHDDL